MVLNPGKCHFTLFGVKENNQFGFIYNDITLKHSSHEIGLGVTIDNKLLLISILLISAKQLTKTSTLSVE